MALRLLMLSLALLAAPPLCAQMPFDTDDTGVTDRGTLHMEISDEMDGLRSKHYPDLRQNTANVKINVGLSHGFELDLDAPYLAIYRASGARSSRGLGDTDMGVKWRMNEVSPSSTRPTFAVSFYTEFPTGDTRQELGSGLTDYALNFIAQAPISERTRFNLNVGILFAGNTSTGVVGIETTRGRVYFGGLSALHDLTPRLTVGGEIFGGVADKSGLDRTQLQAMLGVQYAVRDGATICLGLVAGSYAASPSLGGQLGIALDFPHALGVTAR